MNSSGPLIRNISDTALATAMIRAQENERLNAMFCDPYARRLAGVRGEQIMAAMPAGFARRTSGPFLATTYLFDQFIQEQIQDGVDLVFSLAAGLDALRQPYAFYERGIIRNEVVAVLHAAKFLWGPRG